MPSFALSSPSPIKKKSRSSRGSREMMIPDGVINEEDNEEDDDGKKKKWVTSIRHLHAADC